MRVVVTGGTGFVGAHLLQLLVERGEEVAVLLRPTSNPWRITHLLSTVTCLEGDLQRLDICQPAIAAFAPDTIIHLGWYGVMNTQRDSREQIGQNLHSTLALVDIGIECGCQTWIGLGSQAEYGPQNAIITEGTTPEPTNLYGATKLATYYLATQLAKAASMRFVWLRLFSAYGPKDNPDWMIPYIIRSLLRGAKPSLTAGEQMWDYIYVGDVAEAIYRCAQAPQAYGAINLGSGRTVQLRQIIEMIRNAIDPSLLLGFGEVPYRPDQVMHLQADISKLRALTGWEPRTSLEHGLAATIRWYVTQRQ